MTHVFCRLEEPDDDFLPMCDMTFEIVEKKYDAAASVWQLAFRADATPYEPVGFGAIIPITGWREQVNGEGDEAFHSFWGPVTLHSRGEQSDRLLSLMADYYEIPAPKELNQNVLSKILGRKHDATWKFSNSIECLAVGIESNPALIAKELIRMKLFFDDGIENGHYAEVFFDVDMPEGFVALNEKDEDYRTELVHWLSLPGPLTANPYSHRR
jgi:hypothetical protein